MPTPTDCRKCGRPYYGAAGLLCDECEREAKRPLDAAACSGSSGVEAAVCEDIARRQRVGMNKYGISVADNPLDLRQWLNHAYEECLDQAVYLKRSIAELDRQNDPGVASAPQNSDS
jgi:hypothetical protein